MAVSHLEGDRGYQNWKADPWFNAPPGGEFLFEVRTRVCQTVSQLISSAATVGQALVVTHFFPLLVLFDVLAAGKQVRCDNASISRFELQGVRWVATHKNEVADLAEVAPTPVRYV